MADIKKTKWYARLEKALESEYITKEEFDEILSIGSQPNLEVIVGQSDEASDEGKKVWVIDVKGFWLDAVKTKKEAVVLCRDAGWKIEK